MIERWVVVREDRPDHRGVTFPSYLDAYSYYMQNTISGIKSRVVHLTEYDNKGVTTEAPDVPNTPKIAADIIRAQRKAEDKSRRHASCYLSTEDILDGMVRDTVIALARTISDSSTPQRYEKSLHKYRQQTIRLARFADDMGIQ